MAENEPEYWAYVINFWLRFSLLWLNTLVTIYLVPNWIAVIPALTALLLAFQTRVAYRLLR
jgi:hypothetical protein